MYAPVASRFETYAIEVAPESRAYMEAIFATGSFRAWKQDAMNEEWVIPADEVD
jgi:glutathione S-transferase